MTCWRAFACERSAALEGVAMKRSMDIVVAGLACLMLAPLLAVLAVLVRLKLGGPVLFRQQRPGLDGKPFWLVKFRTMRDALDARGQPLPDDQRLTPFGALLRRSSLDELPELWSVLKGDMSLVGPRPLLMQYLPLYTARQSRRHEVRPGLTGWAQINGRNAISWEDKFELDVWYVDHYSLWLDVRILFITALHVVRPRGIAAPGHATIEPFQGSAR
jgi:lipopolysaccharide/colanic/teichoic acid biosynthesis glycosyltransferase